MKKYLLGVAAIVLATTVVAFTRPAPRVDYFFQFDTSLAPTEANVENVNSWTLAPVQDLSTACAVPTDQKACKIKVPASATEIVGGIRKLKALLSAILATRFTINIYFVSGGTVVIDKRNVVN